VWKNVIDRGNGDVVVASSRDIRQRDNESAAFLSHASRGS
jgi:hypothetical protein